MTEGDIVEILKNNKSFALVSHIMPDGDNAGSLLAFYNLLLRLKKDADLFSSDVIPEVYSFLPNISCFNYQGCGMKNEYDVLIVLDCGSMDRTGEYSSLIDRARTSINIDHHMTNSMFGDINLVDTNASATGELVYRIIKKTDMDIQKNEAVCLYTAILTDTGGFRYSNTSSLTHKIAGSLIDTGIDFGKIHDLVYNNYEYKTIKTMGKVLDSIELYNNGRIAVMQLLHEDLDEFKYEDIDTNDFINYARDIKGVEAAVFIKEICEDEYKISLRSKSSIDVRNVAEKYGGGGHVKAAGCTINGSLQYIKEIILSELQNCLKGEDS